VRPRAPLLVALAVLTTAAAPGVSHSRAIASAADRDANGIFDSLDAKLARAGASGRMRVIVSLKHRATPAAVAGLEEAVGGTVQVRARYSIIPAFAATMTKRQIELTAAQPGVAHVELDGVTHAFNDQSEASFGVTKARIDDPALDGQGLVAAVVDTGIDTSHVDLNGGKVVAFADCTRAVPASCVDAPAYDDNGHGTHVSATIAGDGEGTPDHRYQGVAPRANLVGVKVLAADGSGSEDQLVSGVQWVVDHRLTYGIKVLSVSLGGGECTDGLEASSQALNAAVAAGITVAVAAGNSGPSSCTVAWPGGASEAITVGAMADTGASAPGCSREDCRDGFKEAFFSSRGPTGDGRVKPDVSAPGVDITSAAAGTGNGYVALSGTSMATPFVAGVALLMLDQNPALTPAQIKQALMGTAVDWGAPGADNTYGAGRLDAYAALRAVGAPIASPPAAPAHLSFEGSLPPAGGWTDVPLDVVGTGFPLAATFVGPSGAARLTLLNSSRAAVAASLPPADEQQELGYQPPSSGRYLLRITSVGSGGSYVLDLSGAFSVVPTNVAAPAILGVARERATLTALAGAWASTVPLRSYSFVWQRCARNATRCRAIPRATSATYRARRADVGKALRVVVTASNHVGSASARSSPLVISALRARNRKPPTISGIAKVGQTLRAQSGVWAGTRPLTFRYQWSRCGSKSCQPVGGATQTTYTLRRIDVGERLRVRLGASNARLLGGGQASRTSQPTRIVGR
jgi:serine protease AprX